MMDMPPTDMLRSIAQAWRLPVNELVILRDSDLRIVQDRRGPDGLEGRIRCIAKVEQPIEHLALMIEFPSEKEDTTKNLYQQYRITEVPSGWLEVLANIESSPTSDLNVSVLKLEDVKFARLYLQAFLARPT